MPVIESRILGKVEVTDDKLFFIEEGLLGFENYKYYYLLNMSDDSPFSIFQSKDDKDICFILIDPFTVFIDYKPEIHDDDIAFLNIQSELDLLLLTVVTIKSDEVYSMTANLLGPLVFNLKENKAKQCITIGDAYSTRHGFLLQKEQKEENKK